MRSTSEDVRVIVQGAVAAALTAHIAADARVAIGLSGGIDSMVLLDATSAVAATHRIALSAVHVHHGLSVNAERWARFCAEQCASRGVALVVHRLQLERKGGQSLEAIARRARHDLFECADVDAVMLAHHADDQAETLLLQLLRGAGPHGLAAMPMHREGEPALLRPLLHLERERLAAYAAACGLRWVDDESNADRRFRRNLLRSEITPRLAAAFPGYPATLVRAAAHQAEAASLLDQMAADDARGALSQQGLARERLAALPPPRARNLLRWFLHREGLRAPSSARLSEMLRQFCSAAAGARLVIHHDGARVACRDGRVVVDADGSSLAPAGFECVWQGEVELRVPGGIVLFERVHGEGLDAARAASARVTLRSRAGGERIRLAANRPRHALKKLLQASGTSPSARQVLPLVWCGDELAMVPGIGVAVDFQTAPDQPGWRVEWRPDASQAT